MLLEIILALIIGVIIGSITGITPSRISPFLNFPRFHYKFTTKKYK